MTFRAIRLAVVIGVCAAMPSQADRATFGAVNVGNGIVLHYAAEGKGPPVVFVHGSLSDFSYWKDEVEAFSIHHRAIAYSRRYDFPNRNPARPGYSAVTDADDLAALIRALHLGKVYVVGHSYGALAALFLAARHPELLRAAVLAEPPAISLLSELSGPDAPHAHALYVDIQRRMVAPMQRDFAHGDREAGIADFIDYVFDDPNAWRKMSPLARSESLRDAHEWDVMMTEGSLFPRISPAQLRGIHVPVLIMTGAESYPFLILVDRALAQAIPDAESVTYAGTGHQMWIQRPQACRRDAERFFSRH